MSSGLRTCLLLTALATGLGFLVASQGGAFDGWIQLAQVQTEECGADKVEVFNWATDEETCASLPDVTCEENAQLVYDGSWDCREIVSEEPEPEEGTANRQQGVWSMTGGTKGVDWVHFNMFCRQQWHCNPSQDILTAGTTTVHKTPRRWTNGACTATRFDPACGACLTNKPETPCEIWLEKSD